MDGKIMKSRFMIFMALAAVLTACEPSHLEDNLPASTVYLVDSGIQKLNVFDEQSSLTHRINAYCGGYYVTNPEVSLELSRDALVDYNTANGTVYRMLPEECYELPAASVQMVDRKATFEVKFNVAALKALSKEADYSDLAAQYVLPLSLASRTEGVNVAKDPSVVSQFIVINMTEVYFEILDCNSYDPSHTADMIMDGNTNTYWQNATQSSHNGDLNPPYSLTLEMPASCTISGFKVWRYPSVTTAHKEYGQIEVSLDADKWVKVADIAFGTTSNNNKRSVNLEIAPVEAKYISVTYTDASRLIQGVPAVAIAELEVNIE
jgi:hypothetical protein